MKMKRFATVVAVVAVTGWNTASAQQGTRVQTGQAGQIGQGAQAGQDAQGLQGTQRVQRTLDQSGQSNRFNQSADASRSNSQQGPTVTQALVKKMQKANEAEIELAKLAQQKTDNDEVKQLTKTVIEDHQSLNQQLQKMNAGSSGNAGSRQQNSNNRSDRATSQAGQSGLSRQGDSMGGQSSHVPEQLCKITEQACQNSLEMTKEMLNSKQGQNFNMGFLSQQIVAHTMALAELKAIKSSGPEELNEVVTTAIDKTEQHLKRAKEIAKKLEDNEKSNS